MVFLEFDFLCAYPAIRSKFDIVSNIKDQDVSFIGMSQIVGLRLQSHLDLREHELRHNSVKEKKVARLKCILN